MEYNPLIETDSVSRESVATIDPINNIPLYNADYLCRVCKTKLIKKQATIHTPMECLSQRCQLLETEVIRLKDHDLKSRLQTKELENKIILLEDAIKGLTAPKPIQAAPFNFGTGKKLREQLKKSHSVDVLGYKPEVNYDNIIQSKRSTSRERVGLFGSLGASSQIR